MAHDIHDVNFRTQDVINAESADFSSLMLSRNILDGLNKNGFHKPSPVQLRAIPLGRCGLDMVVQAKSGTGKTCVFTVVALEMISMTVKGIQVIVLAPTREIAVQIHQVMLQIGSYVSGLQCQVFIGGMPLGNDLKKLTKCQIAIGTPGRIKSLIERRNLRTENVRLFVLDEADKLLEQGSFQEQINWIYSTLPAHKQVLALSATYPEYLATHLSNYMNDPVHVRINSQDLTLLGIKQYYAIVPGHHLPHVVFERKAKKLAEFLENHSFQQCLVFSNYHSRAEHLAEKLSKKGWPVEFIAGKQSQDVRLEAIRNLKQFQCRILISTDLTSRGIDCDKVDLVVNLDLPWDTETYLHRIGRAGRFGNYGMALTLVTPCDEMMKLNGIAVDIKYMIKDLDNNDVYCGNEPNEITLKLDKFMEDSASKNEKDKANDIAVEKGICESSVDDLDRSTDKAKQIPCAKASIFKSSKALLSKDSGRIPDLDTSGNSFEHKHLNLSSIDTNISSPEADILSTRPVAEINGNIDEKQVYDARNAITQSFEEDKCEEICHNESSCGLEKDLVKTKILDDNSSLKTEMLVFGNQGIKSAVDASNGGKGLIRCTFIQHPSCRSNEPKDDEDRVSKASFAPKEDESERNCLDVVDNNVAGKEKIFFNAAMNETECTDLPSEKEFELLLQNYISNELNGRSVIDDNAQKLPAPNFEYLLAKDTKADILDANSGRNTDVKLDVEEKGMKDCHLTELILQNEGGVIPVSSNSDLLLDEATLEINSSEFSSANNIINIGQSSVTMNRDMIIVKPSVADESIDVSSGTEIILTNVINKTDYLDSKKETKEQPVADVTGCSVKHQKSLVVSEFSASSTMDEMEQANSKAMPCQDLIGHEMTCRSEYGSERCDVVPLSPANHNGLENPSGKPTEIKFELHNSPIEHEKSENVKALKFKDLSFLDIESMLDGMVCWGLINSSLPDFNEYFNLKTGNDERKPITDLQEQKVNDSLLATEEQSLPGNKTFNDHNIHPEGSSSTETIPVLDVCLIEDKSLVSTSRPLCNIATVDAKENLSAQRIKPTQNPASLEEEPKVMLSNSIANSATFDFNHPNAFNGLKSFSDSSYHEVGAANIIINDGTNLKTERSEESATTMEDSFSSQQDAVSTQVNACLSENDLQIIRRDSRYDDAKKGGSYACSNQVDIGFENDAIELEDATENSSSAAQTGKSLMYLESCSHIDSKCYCGRHKTSQMDSSAVKHDKISREKTYRHPIPRSTNCKVNEKRLPEDSKDCVYKAQSNKTGSKNSNLCTKSCFCVQQNDPLKQRARFLRSLHRAYERQVNWTNLNLRYYNYYQGYYDYYRKYYNAL